MSQHDYPHLVRVLETFLKDHQPDGQPRSLYEPITYINSLGGKRIRPVLLLMAYNLWFDDVAPALPAAQAVEYFHNFSLMHDDIMDEASLRRGQESVHTRFGRNAAILSGDALLIKSFDILIELENKYRLSTSISKIMSKVSLEICEGQQMDMDFEKIIAPSEDAYIEMIRKKTACLLGASMKIGASLAGASEEDADKLYSFGENIGLAFQIQDDILDVFGEESMTGKQQGGDILRGKKNFLYVHLFNSLSEKDQALFATTYQSASSDGKIQPVIELYRQYHMEDYAQNLLKQYFNNAILLLRDISAPDKHILQSFAEALLKRDH